jgi:fructose-1,6-bisphosphatase/inositol monophosphatase family enzyme
MTLVVDPVDGTANAAAGVPLCAFAAAMVIVPAAGGVVIDAAGCPLEIDLDLTRRWSGIVAATAQLGEQLAATIRG